jgi:transcriptional regulator with XRE-family HTH domain
MQGHALKSARLKVGWTQQKAAHRLGVTQAYLSMMESGRRAVPAQLVYKAAKALHLPPSVLPLSHSSFLSDDDLKAELGALGYPGFRYLQGKAKYNPAEVLFTALNRGDLDSRVTEALPWLAMSFSDMDWDWLLASTKLHDRQNRLGFVLSLARELAETLPQQNCKSALDAKRDLLEHSRLAREDTLCRDSMTEAERKWLRLNRSPLAQHWNLLTDLKTEHLVHGVT